MARSVGPVLSRLPRVASRAMIRCCRSLPPGVAVQVSLSEGSSADSFVLGAGSAAELSRVREQFGRDHWVRLRGFLDEGLRDRLLRYVSSASFSFREDDGICTELCAPSGRAPALLGFLCNDFELFDVVRALTGCERIGGFDGRLFKRLPGLEDSWHNDVGDGRMVAMSINLSDQPYSGGLLEIRRHGSDGILHRAPNPGPGDAILMRISPHLQHRVTNVESDVPRTVWAGWFKSGTDSPRARPAVSLATTGSTAGD